MSSFARSHSVGKVAVPGARRRVFYFAAVISGTSAPLSASEWKVEEVPQGISEASRRATKTRSKISAEAEAELEGEIAKSGPVSPTRQPRDNLGVPIDSESKLFDNRKAGKSTPITLVRSRSGGVPWCGLLTSLLESSKTVEEKAAYSNHIGE
jgi:hypothetical protein